MHSFKVGDTVLCAPWGTRDKEQVSLGTVTRSNDQENWVDVALVHQKNVEVVWRNRSVLIPIPPDISINQVQALCLILGKKLIV